ncbi:MAG: hypothetical protein IPM24_22760 [Bryobacterales bacterium]|jgi:hypothetical protein|nr:hypothetical protein [Bryobacterales bacterium]
MSTANSNLIAAIRGPVMMIAIGTLFALDQTMGVSIARTWPGLLIVLGLLILAERSYRP